MSLPNRIREFYRTSSAAVPRPNRPANAVRAVSSRQAGPLYAFVPAHGDSRVGAVQEHLGRTWSEDFGLAVLLVDFAPRGFVDLELGPYARASRNGRLDRRSGLGPDGCRTDSREMKRRLEQSGPGYDVVCADLTHATEEFSLQVFPLAHSIFLVSDTDPASLEMAAEKVRYIRSLGYEDRCALLLRRVPGGVRPDLAEDLAGAPVCGLVENEERLTRLARWLAAPQSVTGHDEPPTGVCAFSNSLEALAAGS